MKLKKCKYWLAAIIGGILYSFLFFFIAFGQENSGDQDTPLVASPANIFSGILSKMGIDNPEASLSLVDIMGDDSAGEYLYSYIYYKSVFVSNR